MSNGKLNQLGPKPQEDQPNENLDQLITPSKQLDQPANVERLFEDAENEGVKTAEDFIAQAENQGIGKNGNTPDFEGPKADVPNGQAREKNEFLPDSEEKPIGPMPANDDESGEELG